MSQINVNPGPSVEHHIDEHIDSGGDRSAAAGINLITVLIVLGVLAIIAWYLFTGPLRAMSTGGTTNVNVNPPPSTSINVNAPAPSQSQGGNTAPSGGTSNTAPAGGNSQPAPAKP